MRKSARIANQNGPQNTIPEPEIKPVKKRSGDSKKTAGASRKKSRFSNESTGTSTTGLYSGVPAPTAVPIIPPTASKSPTGKQASSSKSNKTAGASDTASKPSGDQPKDTSTVRLLPKPSVVNPLPQPINIIQYPVNIPQNQAPRMALAYLSHPIHPDVRFKKLPFYEELSELAKPTNIHATIMNKKIENRLMFSLTPRQANQIATSQYTHPGTNKINHSVQVLLRFCLQETSHEQMDRVPPEIKIWVNGANLELPPATFSSSKKIKELPKKPIDITRMLKISPTVLNWIIVEYPYEPGHSCVAAIYLAKKLASYDLINKMKVKGIKHPDFTRAMIKDKLTPDSNCEIATTSLRVSLNCPLGKSRIRIPCRASTCTHLQCFDAELYLDMNDCRPRWICPVCSSPAPYESLVIDGYFHQVLTSDKLLANVSNIQLLPDGSWKNLMPKADNKEAKSEKAEVKTMNSTVVLDTSGVEDKENVGTVDKNVSVVDLVSSDDEAEDSDIMKNKIKKLNTGDNVKKELKKVIVVDLWSD